MIPQFGLRVSVLLDANGANTTAAAAVLAGRPSPRSEAAPALVLGGTGPVGQRVALLLALQGADVRVGIAASADGRRCAIASAPRIPAPASSRPASPKRRGFTGRAGAPRR